MTKGLPSGSVQAGYLATTIFCNYFMNQAFGLNGVVVMSLFAQLDSVISIALTGIVDNNASFAAMLKGEGDYYGIRSLSKRVTAAPPWMVRKPLHLRSCTARFQNAPSAIWVACVTSHASCASEVSPPT